MSALGGSSSDRVPGVASEIVVITGAAGGQGAASAELLAAQGAHVIALDLAEQPPQRFAGTGIDYRSCSVADEADWESLAAEIQRDFPNRRVRGLVNNAGVTHRARLDDTLRGDWDRVLSVNLTGAMLGMRALAPLMGAGSAIVNIGSSAGLTGHYPAAYTASKWGLRGLTHVAATEYGPRGIRVNILHPGFIDTPMTASAPDAMRRAQLELTPLERVGQAAEVAGAVAFLLSDAASYISGAEIPIDGGFTSSAGAKIMADRISAATEGRDAPHTEGRPQDEEETDGARE